LVRKNRVSALRVPTVTTGIHVDGVDRFGLVDQM